MEITVPLRIEYKNLFTSEQKLMWWGYGEWTEEPDQAQFEYKGYKCLIKRIAIREETEAEVMTGGYLCGYVAIPFEHPWALDEDLVDKSNVHGGITFSEGTNEEWMVGFDCAHSGDLIPSLPIIDDFLERILRNLPISEEQLQSSKMLKLIKKRTYRNMKFCINEAIGLVEEIDAVPLCFNPPSRQLP